MNRKLLILDFVLVIALIYGGVELHSHWSAAKARQAQMPGPALKPAPKPDVPPLPQEPAVLATAFKDVAMNTLFDPTRNPNIPPEPLPPKPPPPEPPPLPSFHGMGNFGDGVVAMMAESGETRTKEIHLGEMIGPFKLTAFDRQEFEVEWDGRKFKRHAGESSAAAAKPAAPAVGGLAPVPGLIPGVATEQTAPVQQQTQVLGPGMQVTETTRLCQGGDSAPAGTVQNGYQKVVMSSPMGSKCYWSAVGK